MGIKKLTNLKLIKSKISKVKLGKNCKIIEPVNLYGCSIGKNVLSHMGQYL